MLDYVERKLDMAFFATFLDPVLAGAIATRLSFEGAEGTPSGTPTVESSRE